MQPSFGLAPLQPTGDRSRQAAIDPLRMGVLVFPPGTVAGSLALAGLFQALALACMANTVRHRRQPYISRVGEEAGRQAIVGRQAIDSSGMEGERLPSMIVVGVAIGSPSPPAAGTHQSQPYDEINQQGERGEGSQYGWGWS